MAESDETEGESGPRERRGFRARWTGGFQGPGAGIHVDYPGEPEPSGGARGSTEISYEAVVSATDEEIERKASNRPGMTWTYGMSCHLRSGTW